MIKQIMVGIMNKNFEEEEKDIKINHHNKTV